MAVAAAVNVVAVAAVDVGAVVALVAVAAGRAHRDRVVLAVVVSPPHSAVPPPVPAPPQRREWLSSPPSHAAALWLWLPCLDRLLPWADAAVCLASRRSVAAVGETRQRRGRKTRNVFNKLQASFKAGRAKDQRPMPATNGSSS